MNIKATPMTECTFCNTKEITHPDFPNMTAVFVEAETSDGNFFPADKAVVINIDDLPQESVYFANFRYSLFWCKPAFGSDYTKVPENTQTLLIKKNDGTYEVIVPVAGEKYKCTLYGDESGLYAKVYSWYGELSECKTAAFVRGTGTNPYDLLHTAYAFAVKMLGDKIKMREERQYPEIFEYLGWCTCDAFYVKVSEDKILAKCQEFKDKNIPVRWTIIDDVYADIKEFDGKDWETRDEMMKLIHTGRLYSFNASPVRFPNGLRHCIDEIKKYDMQVGVWYPATAYWKGVNPDGEVYRANPDDFIERNGYMFPNVKKESMQRLHEGFQKHISEAGAHFVKIDNQSSIEWWYKGVAPAGEIATNMHEVIEDNVYKYFDGRLINCMCMSNENMWNRPRTSVARCSNDFQPENRPWFTNHITQCAYNCLTQGQLNHCDWDMWWTDDGQAVKNSVLRAISGGPIYVSDTSGRSRREVLMPLCLSDGRILRTDIPATPTIDCIFTDASEAETPLKVWSKTGDAYYIAAFNINAENKAVKGSVCITDTNIPADAVCDKYFVTEQFTGKTYIISKNEKIDITLDDNDVFRLFKFIPVKNGIAVAGLCDKFISTLTADNVSKEHFVLREGGDFTFFSDSCPEEITVNGEKASFTYDGTAYRVKCESSCSKVQISITYKS